MLAKLLHVSKVLSEMLVNERGSVICVQSLAAHKGRLANDSDRVRHFHIFAKTRSMRRRMVQ